MKRSSKQLDIQSAAYGQIGIYIQETLLIKPINIYLAPLCFTDTKANQTLSVEDTEILQIVQ